MTENTEPGRATAFFVEEEVNLEGDAPVAAAIEQIAEEFVELVQEFDPKEPVLQSVRFRLFMANVLALVLYFAAIKLNVGIERAVLDKIAELVTVSITGFILARTLRNTKSA